jgi:hypothetical protein
VDGEPPHKEVWLLVQWPEEEKGSSEESVGKFRLGQLAK